MLIQDTDYKVVIGESALKVLSQASVEVRNQAEREAQEEISGYLRPKYDVQAIFTATDSERNPQILMYMCDIALYHMVASLPNKMGYEIRETRYKRAIEWLTSVQAGKVTPNLPQVGCSTATPGASGGEFIYHSQQKLRHNW